jgi:hemerythrin superfamily protein
MANASGSGPQAAQLPEGDVVRILLDQHARIRDLFGQVRQATGRRKQDVFDELRRLLAVHEAAEEMIVRPLTRSAAGGNRIASARNHEEHMAAHLLADLKKLALTSTAFSDALAEFEAKVLGHAEQEEAEEFPLIAKSRSEQQRAWLGRGLRLAEAMAPTHPHPTAAGSTAAQYVLGPFASLLDHARDVMARAKPA